MLASILLLSLISNALALPNGSPLCGIIGSEFQTAHGAEKPDAGFSITVQPQSDLGVYNIVVSKQKNPIHGVLIYVVSEGQETHIGTFAPKKGFMEVANCTGATITHSDDTEKTDTTFKWTAPSDKASNGVFKVNAVVVGMKTPWQSLSTAFRASPPKTLAASVAPNVAKGPALPGTTSSLATKATTSSPAPKATDHKCRRKHNSY